MCVLYAAAEKRGGGGGGDEDDLLFLRRKKTGFNFLPSVLVQAHRSTSKALILDASSPTEVFRRKAGAYFRPRRFEEENTILSRTAFFYVFVPL